MGIPILAPSQGSLKTPMILFQLCGGTRLVLIFFPWRMVFWMGWVNIHLNLLDFSGHVERTEREVEIYKKKSTPNSLLSQLVRAMDDALIRYGFVEVSFGLMWFKITEFQRLYLEIHALLDYLEIYKPRMDGHQPPATTVANCIGAFTNIPQVLNFS